MLKRVSIQNFKSLKDVTLDLQKVNLFIGPNNSGKTNFLKALEFCYNAHKIEEVEILNSEEDDEEEHGKFTFENYTIKDSYSHLKTAFKRDGQLKVNFQLLFDDNVQAWIEWSSEKSRIIRNVDGSNGRFFRTKDSIQALKNDLGRITIYKPDSNKLDKPAPVGRGDDSVFADASNLIAFFDRIRDEYPTAFAHIKADLAKCVPEFTEINFQNVESTEELVKQFGDKTFKRIGLTDARQKTIYWADELSEGTLYFIALLCIINQPNPPKLLLLEEPEKGIHPRRIEEVINFIFGLADDKDVQVIMTTHSPAVVDMFKDMPESVFIFDKDEEGATHVKNLQKNIIEPETEESERLGIDPPQYLNGLGQAWKVGFLGGVPQ